VRYFSLIGKADGDSNGTIDNEELRSCLRKLQIQMSEKEIDDLHHYCDIDNREGIQFQEFVVLLCLMYLLFGPNVTRQVPRFSYPQRIFLIIY
jgi:calcium-binding protein CML